MNRKMKKIMLVVGILAISVVIGGCSDTKVGIVDVDKVMTDSPKVQEYQEQLKTTMNDMVAKLDQDKPNLSPEDVQKRSAEIGTELDKQKQDLTKQLNDSMDQALEVVAKEKKLSVVVYKNGVAQGGIDVTEEVIKKMQ